MAKAPRVESPSKQKRAALYCRVSTFDQGQGDYSSLEDQEVRLRRAAEADGYEIFRVYKEIASSADTDREQLRRMLSEMDKFNAVFVTKLDRLSRSMRDWCGINELMEKQNVALVSVTQKIDTGTPMGRFFRDLLMLFAQFEREMIAERTFEKMAEQAKKGRWGGGHTILGYDVVNKKLVANRDEMASVLALYRRYLELGSLARTARWANLQGHRTKRHKYASGREAAPKKFTRADIQRTLTNGLYVGKVRFDGVDYTAEHEAIVPPDLFMEVQILLSARKEQPRRAGQKQQDTLLLGLLRCGHCGSAYTSSFVNKKVANGEVRRYYYYKCTRKTKRDAQECPSADLRADVVDRALVQFFHRMAQDPERLKELLDTAAEASRDGCSPIEKEREKLSKELSLKERHSQALVERLTDPELTDVAAIKNRLVELDGEQKELRAQISDLTLQLRDRRDQVISVDELQEAYQQFEKLWVELSFEERQGAIRLLVRDITLLFNRGEEVGEMRIRAWGRSPVPIKVKIADFRKLRSHDVWLPGLDSNQEPRD